MTDEYARVENTRHWRMNQMPADEAAAQGDRGAHRRNWDDGMRRQRRLALMGGPTAVRIPEGLDVDIDNADHQIDVNWLEVFDVKMEDPI